MTTPSYRSSKALLFCLAVTALFAYLDLWTKGLAADHLPCRPELEASCREIPGKHPSRSGAIVLVHGYLDLAYAENRGAAFGMLNDAPDWLRTGLFTTAAVVAVGALLWMFITGSGGRLFALAVPLVMSGALGNMIDRWRLGYVVDFIRFHIHDGWEWPTFNVADCTIAVGVALLLLDGVGKADAAPVVASDSSVDNTAAQNQTG